jgi:hypothetical protein
MEEIKDWFEDNLKVSSLVPFLWGFVCALIFAQFGYSEIAQGWGVAIGLSLIKETLLSEKFDLDNIILCILGLALSTMLCLLLFFS